MATVGQISKPPHVVLRVKRKREEDPVEALMITKQARIDPLQLLDSNDTSVFHFAGTVSSQAVNEKLILDKVRQHKDHSKLTKQNPLARLSLSEAQEQRREQNKATSRSNRYRVVSEYRSLDRHTDEEELLGFSESAKNSIRSPPTGSEAKTDINFHLFDIEQESRSDPDHSTLSSTSDQTVIKPSSNTCSSPSKATSGLSTPMKMGSDILDNHSDITCNSTRLIREQINPESISEFVYDLYYTQDLVGQRMSSMDWSSMTIHDCGGVELVHDIIDSDDEYCNDDEEDSNDESNWRNDYPDEEDLSGAGSDSDSDEFHYRQAALDDDFSHYEHGDLYR